MRPNTSFRGLLAIAAATLLTVGCATSSDRPTEQLTRAEATIESAEQAGARQYSPDALAQARSKLTDARQAADAGDANQARRLAHQAELDAEFAVARANRMKAETSLDEINDSIETLRREISRGSTR